MGDSRDSTGFGGEGGWREWKLLIGKGMFWGEWGDWGCGGVMGEERGAWLPVSGGA